MAKIKSPALRGTVLRWNGTAWSTEPVSLPDASLWDVTAANPGSVLAVGARPRAAIGTRGTFAIRANNG